MFCFSKESRCMSFMLTREKKNLKEYDGIYINGERERERERSAKKSLMVEAVVRPTPTS